MNDLRWYTAQLYSGLRLSSEASTVACRGCTAPCGASIAVGCRLLGVASFETHREVAREAAAGATARALPSDTYSNTYNKSATYHYRVYVSRYVYGTSHGGDVNHKRNHTPYETKRYFIGKTNRRVPWENKEKEARIPSSYMRCRRKVTNILRSSICLCTAVRSYSCMLRHGHGCSIG